MSVNEAKMGVRIMNRLKIVWYSPLKSLSVLLYTCLIVTSVHAVPTLAIPQYPLILAAPLHPQVLIAIGNSQSMDGNLSGAIMTGSGSLSVNLGALSTSSSPLNYLVPAGFTPPLQAANGSGLAPYTVNQGLNLGDNSPSRLNVAKGAVTNIIQSYMATSDFALETFNTSNATPYNTWVYYMSPPGSDFVFTNNNTNSANSYVRNPCYQYTTATATILANCTLIDSYYGGASIANSLYMQVGDTSDSPSINDVLYAGAGFPGVFLTYTGPTPVTPYPPNYSIANYNNGTVSSAYAKTLPNVGRFSTSPTNAGYVPYSQQVMYSQRGFGYYGTQSAISGTLVVPMTTAGSTPTSASITTAINLFLPKLKPETNSAATTEIKSIATQSPIAGLLTSAYNYMRNLGATSGNGCPQPKYVILISDGLPTQDLSGKLWPPLGSASAIGYGVTATFNADGSLNTTNNQALLDSINVLKLLNTNGIKTYIVGLGAGVSTSLNPQAAATLKAMAVAGGTQDYYPATDPASLTAQLGAILVSIQNGAFSISAATISSTRLTTNALEYQASFVSYDQPYQDWTGDLKAIALDPVTGAPSSTVTWSAQSMLDTLVAGSGWSTSRDIATYDPVSQGGIPFTWASLNAAQKLLLQPVGDTNGSNRVDYLRGNTALEKRNGGVFRNRTHILGDLIDSQALFVGAPSQPFLSSSYITFAKAQINRQPMIYIGGNDGMLHAFDATTGAEVFAYIPNAVIKNLYNLSLPLYNQSHLYYVNGSPTSSDVLFSDNTWHTVLVGGEGAGGNSIFALDITNPATFASDTNVASSVLWEFTDVDMGLTFSNPKIAPISATSPTSAVFFGNGYNSTSNNAVFYAINPQTGAVLKKINLCSVVTSACNATLPQGLSSVSVGQIDGIQSLPITTVYAGDLQGNLWAINVSDPTPSLWTARLLFQARDSGGNAQAITTAPVVTLQPTYPRKQGLFIMFGTGRLLISNDLLDTQTQSVYGIWDNPANSSTLTRANLQQQTLTLSSGISPIITATSSTINWNSKFGWYDDLPSSGQRVVVNPDIVNGALVSVLNTPPLSACGALFSSMLLELNFTTGGAFTQAILDVNNDGQLNSGDMVLGLFAVGMSLGNQFSSAPVFLGTNKNNNLLIMTTQASGSQSLTINPNTLPKKVGWWELQ